MDGGESQPLLGVRTPPNNSRGASYYTCAAIFLIGCVALIVSVAVSYQYSGQIITPNTTTTKPGIISITFLIETVLKFVKLTLH